VRAGLEADGIVVVTGAKVVAVERPAAGGPVTVTAEDGRAFVGDELLVAVGRRPATTDLGLDSVGLAPGRAVEVDDRLRATGVAGGWLYAVGDVNGGALLTHMGSTRPGSRPTSSSAVTSAIGRPPGSSPGSPSPIRRSRPSV
jgi:dihydrolipoamide dehydrogenase